MKAILDTHTFLWWNTDDPQLSSTARQFIENGLNDVYLSAASAWEIAIKCARGRLTLPDVPDQYVADRIVAHQFYPLPVQISHALHVFNLPDIHRDPFDRLLVAQSQLEDLAILTADNLIPQYGVSVIW
jgi:PIN domain nuclease of toxin-antitoxin system